MSSRTTWNQSSALVVWVLRFDTSCEQGLIECVSGKGVGVGGRNERVSDEFVTNGVQSSEAE